MGKINDINDIVGKKFGRWTVLSYDYSKGRYHYYNCQCDCGNIHAVYRDSLLTGVSQSCGCLRGEMLSKAIRKDMIGKKFNKLIVIEEAGKNKYGRILYKCKCDCGNEKIVPGVNLRNGTVKSCGCLVRDVAKERRGKPCANGKDLTGQRFGKLVVLGISSRRGNSDGIGRGLRFKCRCDCGNICEVSSRQLIHGGAISCGCALKESFAETINQHKKDVCVDGTNLDILNTRNTKANTSGRKGVRRNGNSWLASIKFQGKAYYKTCKTFEEAVEARERMEKEYWEPTLTKYGRELK